MRKGNTDNPVESGIGIGFYSAASALRVSAAISTQGIAIYYYWMYNDSDISDPLHFYYYDQYVKYVDIKFTSGTLLTLQKGNLYFNNNGGGGIWVIDTSTGDVIFNSAPPGHQQNSHDVYLSSLAVGNGYMINVGHLRLYALRSFE